MSVPQSPLPARALGHAQLTVSTSAVPLPDPPSKTRRTVIRVLSNPINFTDSEDDTPTGSFGFPLLANETLVTDADPNHIQLIRSSAATGDADVRIAFYN